MRLGAPEKGISMKKENRPARGFWEWLWGTGTGSGGVKG
jgi:hypothetical protein